MSNREEEMSSAETSRLPQVDTSGFRVPQSSHTSDNGRLSLLLTYPGGFFTFLGNAEFDPLFMVVRSSPFA